MSRSRPPCLERLSIPVKRMPIRRRNFAAEHEESWSTSVETALAMLGVNELVNEGELADHAR